MQIVNTKLTRGILSVNKKKLEKAVAAAAYIGLLIAHKLLITAAIAAIIITAAAGGDGKISNGNIKTAVISFLIFLVCTLAAKFTSTAMTNFKATSRKRFRAG